MLDFFLHWLPYFFETAFHINRYSYCCCRCAFEHEYLDYLSDSLDINEEIYQEIVQCVVNKKVSSCRPRDPEFVRETSILGMYLASACAKEALKFKLDHYRIERDAMATGIFCLDPCSTADLKANCDTISLRFMFFFMYIFANREFKLVIYARRMVEESKYMIELDEPSSQMEFCARKKDSRLLETFLHIIERIQVDSTLVEALHFAYRHNLTDTIEMLLKDNVWLIHNSDASRRLAECRCELAIIYDQPNALDKLLKYLQYEKLRGSCSRLPYKTYLMLRRERCREILAKHGICWGTICCKSS